MYGSENRDEPVSWEETGYNKVGTSPFDYPGFFACCGPACAKTLPWMAGAAAYSFM